jgi:gluconate kinase
MDQRIRVGQRAVIACSALKRDHRDELLDGRPAAVMAFLEIDVDAAPASTAACDQACGFRW